MKRKGFTMNRIAAEFDVHRSTLSNRLRRSRNIKKQQTEREKGETPPTPDGKLPITSSLFRGMRFDAALRKNEENAVCGSAETAKQI
jgi:hypothetical protein